MSGDNRPGQTRRTWNGGRGASDSRPPSTKRHHLSIQNAIANRVTGRSVDTATPLNVQQRGGSRNMISFTSEMIQRLPLKQPRRLKISTVSAEYLQNSDIVITSDSRDPQTFGGVNDIRMGSTDDNETCGTCFQYDCPGHVGYIPLNVFIIDPLRARAVISVLSSVCHGCGKPLMDKRQAELDPALKFLKGADRLSYIADASTGMPCIDEEHMEEFERNERNARDIINPKCVITESKGKNYVVLEGNNKLYPDEILDIFSNISNEDARFLGFSHGSHPRDLIIQNLAVPPPVARPPVVIDDEVHPDKLTEQYAKIVSINNKIRPGDRISDQIPKIYELIQMIQSDRESSGGSKSSIASRIQQKKGLLRQHLMGKRTNHIARSVISPNSTLKFGEIGVSEKVARSGTFPVQVTQANFNHTLDLYRAGRINTWTPSHGQRKGEKIRLREDIVPEFRVGDMIGRWYQDGDVVVFNRQPSLHRYSLMGYTVKIVSGETTDLHPSSTTPHNADFDGDTGNLMFPHTPKSVHEARTIMHAVFNMMSETQNKPVVGIIMDSVTSAFLMTRPEESVNPFMFSEMLGHLSTPVDMVTLQQRAVQYGLHPFSGRTLFSSLFPEDFFYQKGKVVIIDGILVSGRPTSAHLGTAHRSIVQDLHKLYGPQRAADFITDATWLLLAWLDTYGFSIGPADCDYGEREQSRLAKRAEFEQIYAQLANLKEIPDDPLEAQRHEEKVQRALGEIDKFGRNLIMGMVDDNELTEILGRPNAIAVMGKESGAGSKGDPFNYGQIFGAGGQQFYNGARMVPRGNETRVLPTHPFRENQREEAPPEERGYVQRSYWEGLSPEGIFAMLWGGRQGLINTANSTAAVGTMQRDLSKALEGIVYGDDGTIRSTNGNIYAFSYGGDELDVAHLMNVQTPSYGTVSLPFDADSLIDKINAEHGWIKEEYLEGIEENRNMNEFVEHDLARSAVRRDEFEQPPAHMNRPYGVPEAAVMLSDFRDQNEADARNEARHREATATSMVAGSSRATSAQPKKRKVRSKKVTKK